MALKNFKLVHTDGLQGITFQGDFIPFDKIDDTRAELLVGKTHVLERVTDAPATVPAQLALAEATEPTSPAAEEATAPSTSRRRNS